MKAGSSGNIKCSSTARDMKEHVRTMTESVDNERASVYNNISANAEQVALAPELAQRLINAGRGEQADKLLDFSQTIAKDVDSYIKDAKRLDVKLNEIKSQSPTKTPQLAKQNSRCMSLGLEYRNLNDRIVRGLIPGVTQLLELAEIDIVETDNTIDVEFKTSDKPSE